MTRFALYEPVEFVHHFLANKLEFSKVRDSIAIHVPCSSKKMGIADSFMTLASKCAHEVTNTDIPCCGMAGAFVLPLKPFALAIHMGLPHR